MARGNSAVTTVANIQFVDNAAIRERRDQYLDVTVDVARILESWQASLYSFEWMLPDGRIKTRDELPENEQPKRDAVEEKIKRNRPLEKPILGIGLLENVEIGSGRATFLTLAATGLETIPVHIPKSNKDEFAPFLS